MRKSYLIYIAVAALAITGGLSGLTYLIELFVNTDGSGSCLRFIVITVTSFCWGAYRVCGFHPAADQKYRLYLSYIPWVFSKPLLKGPLHLVWEDVVVIGWLTLLVFINDPKFYWVALLLFGLVYLLGHLLVFFMTRQYGYALAFLFILPCTVYPVLDIKITLSILAALYVWCYFGQRDYLKNFPWQTDFWKIDQEQAQLNRYKREAMIGWPCQVLVWMRQHYSVKWINALFISGLLTWWLHVLVRLCYEMIFRDFNFNQNLDYEVFWKITSYPVGYLTVLMAFLRLGKYIQIAASPINLWGRLATGRLIIPKYDQIFCGPLLILFVGAGIPCLMGKVHFFSVVLVEACFFLSVLIRLTFPPKLEDWLLTGDYRLRQSSLNKSAVRNAVSTMPDTFNRMLSPQKHIRPLELMKK